MNIYKSIKAKTVKGKSLAFLIIIEIGYVAGILHKVFYSRDIVMVLYILNLLMVGVDICLYFRNKRLDEAREACSAQA